MIHAQVIIEEKPCQLNSELTIFKEQLAFFKSNKQLYSQFLNEKKVLDCADSLRLDNTPIDSPRNNIPFEESPSQSPKIEYNFFITKDEKIFKSETPPQKRCFFCWSY
ncbi:MAG: hypothetical protein PSV35_03840 [bacterium]|nr:hypothetical protein [bacterium]